MMKLLKERKNKSSDSLRGEHQSFFMRLTHPVIHFHEYVKTCNNDLLRTDPISTNKDYMPPTRTTCHE